MATALNLVLGIAVLIVAVWIVIFGGVGSLLCKSRGGTGAVGFTWGALLGPVGWLAILWFTRNTTARVESTAAAVTVEPSSWSTGSPWDD